MIFIVVAKCLDGPQRVGYDIYHTVVAKCLEQSVWMFGRATQRVGYDIYHTVVAKCLDGRPKE